MCKYVHFGIARWRTLVVACAVMITALAISACGKTSSSSTSNAVGSSSSASASGAANASGGSCGTVPTIAPVDQSGFIKTLPASVQAQYNAFNYPIVKSPWANRKPKNKGPITIGVSTIEPANSYAQQLNAALSFSALKKEIPNLGKVVALTYPLTSSGLTTQIQQIDQLIQEHVDYIVSEDFAPQAFVPVAKRAYQAGIPFISLLNITPSPYAINIGTNLVGANVETGAWLAKQIGGKGLVLGVHGIPATTTDADSFTGWSKAFAHCPGIKFNTSPVGDFQEPVAKSAVLSYLGTHPTPVAGVVEPNGMASGIVEAFQQTGRKVPPMVVVGPTLGDLTYWAQNKSTFKAYGYDFPAPDSARSAAFAIAQMQSGHNPSISMIMGIPPTIDTQTLSQWAQPGASLTDPTSAKGPGTWLPLTYLKQFFR